MIKTIRVALKIGFSSALNPDTISAYQEMYKWKFPEEAGLAYRMKRAFCKGYMQGIKTLMDVRQSLREQSSFN